VLLLKSAPKVAFRAVTARVPLPVIVFVVAIAAVVVIVTPFATATEKVPKLPVKVPLAEKADETAPEPLSKLDKLASKSALRADTSTLPLPVTVLAVSFAAVPCSIASVTTKVAVPRVAPSTLKISPVVFVPVIVATPAARVPVNDLVASLIVVVAYVIPPEAVIPARLASKSASTM